MKDLYVRHNETVRSSAPAGASCVGEGTGWCLRKAPGSYSLNSCKLEQESQYLTIYATRSNIMYLDIM